MGKKLMIQGTASSVGKSLLCTALCRIFTQDGYNVNPFKSQNMSLNSYVTLEGHEMGRAQVMQAEASGKSPSSKMNPILLKPTTDRRSQVIVKGKVYKNMDAVEYFAFKPHLKDTIRDIYNELENESDIVVIEGAGSPAEINLKENDIVNMGMAKLANAPVILVGDIDRGGVFAALAGTLLLLNEEERKMIKGVIINKFRGSVEILEPGLRMLEDIIKVPILGVIPYFKLNIEDEDSVSESLEDKSSKGELDIAVIRLPHISNFTDFNALKLHSDVGLRYVCLDEPLGQPDVIIIPGTKSTIADMDELTKTGMSAKIHECHLMGSIIFGICGGFQMLGNDIKDPDGIESSHAEFKGMGLIDAVTEFKGEKTTIVAEGIDSVFNCKVKGYEIHMGETYLVDNTKPFIEIKARNRDKCTIMDGAVNSEKTVFGTYMHGVFDSSVFTRNFLNLIRKRKGMEPLETIVEDYWKYKEEQYDKLADIVRSNLDMEKIYNILKVGIDG